VAGFERIGEESPTTAAYSAFRRRFTDRELELFTEPDNHGHEALGALDGRDRGRVWTVASYVRRAPDAPNGRGRSRWSSTTGRDDGPRRRSADRAPLPEGGAGWGLRLLHRSMLTENRWHAPPLEEYWDTQ